MNGYTVIDKLYEEPSRLVEHQLNSYNYFIDYKIDSIIDDFNPNNVVKYNYNVEEERYMNEYIVKFGKISLGRPVIQEPNGQIKPMYPHDARLRNLTYSAALYCDVEQELRTYEKGSNNPIIKNLPKITRHNIGSIPIMLHSKFCILREQSYKTLRELGECSKDYGGYFIVNGNEKVIISIEKKLDNKVLIFQQSKQTSSYSHIAEISSVNTKFSAIAKLNKIKLSSKNTESGKLIRVEIPDLKDLPLFVVFRALGIIPDKNILELIGYDLNDMDILNLLRPSLEEANRISNKRLALEYISKYVQLKTNYSNNYKVKYVEKILVNNLFPHVGKDLLKKAYFLGYAVNKLLNCYLGKIDYDDRDSFFNKRIETAGSLMGNLFRTYFNQMVKKMKSEIESEISKVNQGKISIDEIAVTLDKKIKPTTIYNGFKYALSTGNWGTKTGSHKTGVAQVLRRLSYNDFMSHLRRVIAPMDRTMKSIEPRKLHNTQYGMICPSETPEGANVGIVKNMACTAHITINGREELVIETLEELGLQGFNEIVPKDVVDSVKVFVNGDWVGIHEEPNILVNKLLTLRRKGVLNIYTSIGWNIKTSELNIYTDAGRICRPLFIVRDNKIMDTDLDKYSWDDMLTGKGDNEGIIEYVDVNETDSAMIAMRQSDLDENKRENESFHIYTHCEIIPDAIFGSLASSIPFSDMNQGPRLTYQCLGVDEKVLMADGSYKRIADVEFEDKVITFHPETFELSETFVVDQFVRRNINPVYKLTTQSGKEIIATSDHKFISNKGETSVEEFIENPDLKIGVSTFSYEIKPVVLDEPKLIIDRRMFIEKMEKLGVLATENRKMSRADKYANELEDIGLLPLYSNNPKLLILSRIMGFLATDGSINVYRRNNKYKYVEFWSAFDFGEEQDAIKFNEDVSKCGFKKVKIREGTRTFTVEGRKRTHHTFCNTYSTLLPAFLISLGVTYGKKTETPVNPLPWWIMDIKEYGRQYMKGFQGGDGCKINVYINNKRQLIRTANTGKQIQPEYLDSLINFMNQCVTLLNKFEIKVTDKLNIKKISEIRTKVAYTISSNIDNLIKYYDEIGYAYDSRKNMCSFKCVEYLKIKKQLNLSNNNEAMNYINKVFEEKNGMVFVPIQKIERVSDRMISDITVFSENHNFISSNGLMSKNCAQGKQAMGLYAENYLERMDTMGSVLYYPQKPLVNTKMSNYFHGNEMLSGINTIVAIMCYTGFNQEDSLIFNQNALDRGLFTASYYKTYKNEEQKNQLSLVDEIFCKPEKYNSNGTIKTSEMKSGSYDKIGEDGLPIIGKRVEGGDIIIGKVIPLKNVEVNMPEYKDASTILKTTEKGVIDKVYVNKNADGYKFMKVRVRDERVPEIGDKFCLTPDHDVLTKNRGWISIAEMTKEDYVATLVDGEKLVYEKPSDVYQFDVEDEDMYQVKSQQVNICATMNHRMYVKEKDKYELIEAKDLLNKEVYYKSEDGEFMVNKSEIIKYTGKVYCCTVSSHVFYVRRNGIPVWTGNSSRHGYFWL